MRVQKKSKAVKYIAIVFSVVVFLLISIVAFSQEDDVDVLAYGINRYGRTPDPQGDFTTLTIPLKRAQNLLLIEGRINGVEGNFILDTGAPHLVLNKTYFRTGKLADGTSASGVTGGAAPVYHLSVDSLVIDELYYTELDADLVNLGHLEDAKGVKILGLLGANLFSKLIMEVDVRNNTLTLTKSDESQEWPGTGGSSANPDLRMPFDFYGDIIFVNGMVAGKKLRFCLDTGAETNVLSNSSGNKVLDQFELMSRTDLGGSSSTRLNVLSGQLKEITIGDKVFKKLPVILTDLSGLTAVYNTSLDGILGYEFLSNGRVVINFSKKELSMYFYKEEGQ